MGGTHLCADVTKGRVRLPKRRQYISGTKTSTCKIFRAGVDRNLRSPQRGVRHGCVTTERSYTLITTMNENYLLSILNITLIK